MVRLIVRLAIIAVALWVAALLVTTLIPDGMVLTSTFPDLLFVAIIFGVVNLLVKPVLSFVSCPITILTLGLFTFVINALVLLLTSFVAAQIGDGRWLSFGGPWNGFLAAMLAGVIISIVSTVLSSLADD